ncbi:alpha/beta hydrolase [Streptomyces yaizuensis]|uniref:Alpha/beta hydrolase n=1 Tax=Streptomyces yaizuensis TaxID=2989713 RepID=A0ABQ5NXB0_9ACTN|nr:alpha/beta hydrolase [Streptomyces sp. YSPA8]GLF94996.1 alpha/beta hydrolase [Streptomyces sp. YSPA8]
MRLRRIGRGLAPLLSVSALAALVPALTTAPASAEPTPAATTASSASTTSSASAADPLARFTGQRVDWRSCGEGIPATARCATLTMPLDYRDPGGRTVDVEISRSTASVPGKRLGALFLNPGGPGGAGVDFPYSSDLKLPKVLKERYDLIGFDPRGVGRSTPVACGLRSQERMFHLPYKPSTFAHDIAVTRNVADRCRAKYGTALRHFTTRETARDMEVIRAVLGERKLNFLGYSYGSYLGAIYTQLFPARSGRVVLDSAIDPALAWRKDHLLYGSEVEKAFTRWTEWTARRSATYGLGRTPAAVSASFWGIVARADRAPVVTGGVPLTGDEIRALMQPRFYTTAVAAASVAMLKDAVAGKPTKGFAEARQEADDESLSLFWAVHCGDANWSRNPETYRKEAARNKLRQPIYGDYAGNITPCAFWDRPAEKPVRVDNGVRALILQNEWDQATPLIGAQGLRKALRNSRLVVADEAEGHGVYATGRSACADRITTAYLIDGRYPAADRVCAAEPAPARQRLGSTDVPGLVLPPHRR